MRGRSSCWVMSLGSRGSCDGRFFYIKAQLMFLQECALFITVMISEIWTILVRLSKLEGDLNVSWSERAQMIPKNGVMFEPHILMSLKRNPFTFGAPSLQEQSGYSILLSFTQDHLSLSAMSLL